MTAPKAYTILIYILAHAAIATAAAASRSLTLRGLPADGRTLCTATIQQAIDRMARRGGGTLTLPAGRYLTGTLRLRSHITLRLDSAATLLGSTDPADYQKLRPGTPGDPERRDNSLYALLMADGADQVAITGKGTIDGQGRELAARILAGIRSGTIADPYFNGRRLREVLRPKLIFLHRCTDAEVSGLTLRNAAVWGLSCEQCRGLSLHHLDIYNRAAGNNDGIDLIDSHCARIHHCTINSNDDGICFKSYPDSPGCADVEVSDCTIRSSASAVKFGTASWTGFRRFRISRIRVFDTLRSAIAIESADGGQIDSIAVDSILVRHTANAFFIRLSNRNRGEYGSLRNVSLRHIDAQLTADRPDEGYPLPGPSRDFSGNPLPASVSGWPGHCVENVLLDSISIIAPGGADPAAAAVSVADTPEAADRYPEYDMTGRLPAWGLFLRHVRDITIGDFRLTALRPDCRPMVAADDVRAVWSPTGSAPLQ